MSRGHPVVLQVVGLKCLKAACDTQVVQLQR